MCNLQWDDKITTLPGLYLFTIGALNPLAHAYAGINGTAPGEKGEEGDVVLYPISIQLDVCFYSSLYDLYLVIEKVTEGKPVVDLSEELAHVGRVFGLHLPLEPVHLVHVLAGRKN